MPSDEFRARLVEAWYEAFDDTFIQNRYPTAATKAHGMGYFDDSLGYATLEGTSRHFLPKLKERARPRPGRAPRSAASSTRPSRSASSPSR